MKPNKYTIKKVSNREELLDVFGLVKENYIQSGYMNDNDSFEITKFYHLFVPTTNIFINIHKDQVISTATLFTDSKEYGLPSDITYEKEYNELRDSGRNIVEGGLLAGSQGRPLLYLMSFFFQTTKDIHADDILLVVNPKHVNFYRNMLYFDAFGAERKCARVNGAPGVLMRFNIKEFNPDEVKNKTLQRIFLSQ